MKFWLSFYQQHIYLKEKTHNYNMEQNINYCNLNKPEHLDKSIKNVYHIADIHIRQYKRHEEYLLVFDNLYKELIKQNNLEESIIVIVGDILHSKNELTPELIDEVEENYINTYDNFQEFADEEADMDIRNTVNSDGIDFVLQYFDYIGYADDIRHSYTVLHLPDYSVAVFTNC